MHPALIILACGASFLIGVVVGILIRIWYDENVEKPVDREQQGGPFTDDDRVYFDCEAV